MVIRYGAYFLSLTGLVILLGDFMYSRLHYGPALVIPFPGENLHFEYGWCFWLSLVTGEFKTKYFSLYNNVTSVCIFIGC